VAVERALQAAIMFVMEESKPLNQRAESETKIQREVKKSKLLWMQN
jgi:hypothetical protein